MSSRHVLCRTQLHTAWSIPRCEPKAWARRAWPDRVSEESSAACMHIDGGRRGAQREALLCRSRYSSRMFNERAVCQAIIDSACEMHWPSDRFCVQVRPAQPPGTISCARLANNVDASCQSPKGMPLESQRQGPLGAADRRKMSHLL